MKTLNKKIQENKKSFYTIITIETLTIIFSYFYLQN